MKKNIITIISLSLILFLLKKYGVEAILRPILKIELKDIFYASSAIIFSYALGFFRYLSLINSENIKVSKKTLFNSYAIGHVGNLLFFNVIGQTLGRTIPLDAGNISSGKIAFLSLYEKIISTLILSLFALFGLVVISPVFNFELNQMFYVFAFNFFSMLLIFFILGMGFFRRKKMLHAFANFFIFANKNHFAFVLTAFMHMSMLVAYLCLARSLIGMDINIQLAAVLFIVMFCSSLPISFSGWGIRELSAAFSLGLIGVQSELGVSLGVAIGLLSQSIVFIVAVSINAINFFKKNQNDIKKTENDKSKFIKDNSSKKMVLFLVFFISIAIYFQIWIPVGGSLVAINLGDGAALFCFVIFLLFYKFMHKEYLKTTNFFFLFSVSLVLVYSIILGYLKYGPITWALSNRGLGWFVIIGYFIAGQLISFFLYEKRDLLLKTFVYASFLICVIQLVIHAVQAIYNVFPIYITPVYFVGYAANPNAYGFQLLMSFVVCIVLGSQALSKRYKKVFTLMISVITLNIYFSDSRASLLILLLLMFFPLRFSGFETHERKSIAIAFSILVMAMFFTYPGFENGRNYIKDFFIKNDSISSEIKINLTDSSSDNERFASILNGLDLWSGNKVFGAGLGANIYHQKHNDERVVLIHSVPAWLLGETGLLGFLLFFVPLSIIFYRGIQLLQFYEYKRYALGVVMTIFAFVIGGLVHDYFYQRTFWFVLGMLIFNMHKQNLWEISFKPQKLKAFRKDIK